MEKDRAVKNIALAALLLAGAAIAQDASAAGGPPGHGHGIGEPGDPAKASRVLRIEATDDMRFRPAAISVRRDETVKFVIVNKGALRHEFMLGTAKDLKEHAAEMLKNPEMEHDDDNAVSVEAGQSRELVWRFTRSGRIDFGCLIPGHYDGGMRGRVSVSTRHD